MLNYDSAEEQSKLGVCAVRMLSVRDITIPVDAAAVAVLLYSMAEGWVRGSSMRLQPESRQWQLKCLSMQRIGTQETHDGGEHFSLFEIGPRWRWILRHRGGYTLNKGGKPVAEPDLARAPNPRDVT